MQFTKVGTGLFPSDFLWPFLVVSVGAALYSLIPRKRGKGRTVAIGAALLYVFPFLTCYLVAALAILSAILNFQDSPRNQVAIWHRKGFWPNVLCLTLAICFTIWGSTGQEIELREDLLVCKDAGVAPDIVEKAHLGATELLGNDGQICEWRFSRVPSKESDSYVVRMNDTELFWDHRGHILTAQEVAAEIRKWGKVSSNRQTFESLAFRE